MLDSEGRIDRRALGGMVFGHPTRLQSLNSIVWPEIARLAMERAGELWRAGHQLVVLDAAVLLEAGWDSLVHEVGECQLCSAPLHCCAGVGVCAAAGRGRVQDCGPGREDGGGGREEGGQPAGRGRPGRPGHHRPVHPVAARVHTAAGGAGRRQTAD